MPKSWNDNTLTCAGSCTVDESDNLFNDSILIIGCPTDNKLQFKTASYCDEKNCLNSTDLVSNLNKLYGGTQWETKNTINIDYKNFNTTDLNFMDLNPDNKKQLTFSYICLP